MRGALRPVTELMADLGRLDALSTPITCTAQFCPDFEGRSFDESSYHWLPELNGSVLNVLRDG